MVNKVWTGIGSRETPEHLRRDVILFANIMTQLGYAYRSGGCPKGMDAWTQWGVYRHGERDKSRHRVYLSWDGMADLRHNPESGVYDAQRFSNYEQAVELGLKARGSWNGLGKGGIALHSRNPYQILGDDLQSPSAFVLTWAPPVGKAGRVKGGTATAVQIALDHGVPVYNLYHDEIRDRVQHLTASVRAQLLRPLNEAYERQKRDR